MTTKRLVLLVLVAAVVVVLGYIGTGMYRSSTAPARAVGALEEQWRERIAQVGGVDAYAEFAAQVESLSVKTQHERAHAFGAALFDIEGEKGLPVCDSRFNFGCFHEFLGRAIAAVGVDRVSRLNDACFEALAGNPLACQHGIGHGIQAAIGYTEPDLLRALGVCKALSRNDPVGGCFGGVFMEYNVRTMLGPGGGLREAKADVYAPCSTVEKAYKEACYFWQPQWWHQAFLSGGAETSKSFLQMGQYCDALNSPADKRSCFEGIGNIAGAAADFEPVGTRALCDSTSGDLLGRVYCRSFAANSLSVGGGGKRAEGGVVCEGLPAASYEYCLSYAENKHNVVNQAPLPPVIN